MASDSTNFDHLCRLAEETVVAVQRRLPADVRIAAAAVPVCFEAQPSQELVADGLDADLLGLFVGPGYDAENGETPPLPSQILLFIENIRDLAGGDPGSFRREVRLTYLHELGHYLGWDEEEIALRGLE